MFSYRVAPRTIFALFAALFVVLTPIAHPKTAVAKATTSEFTASGVLCLFALPTSMKTDLTKRGLKVTARGEQLAGAITSSSWAEINDAAIEAVINKEESLFDLANGTFEGKIKGDITIASPDEVMQGSINGTISGAFVVPITDPADLLMSIYTSTAEVKWNIRNKGSDSDDDDKSRARGTASVTFVADPDGSYCGPIILNGTYREK